MRKPKRPKRKRVRPARGPLSSWRELNRVINDLSEGQVEQLLDVERGGQRRSAIMTRLHQRYTALRAKREREKLKTNP